MRQVLTVFVLILLVLSGYGQGSPDAGFQDSLKILIEDHIVSGQYDSARVLLGTLEVNSEYIQVLQRIAFEQAPSYEDYIRFYESATSRVIANYMGLKDFLEKVINAPPTGAGLDLNYVWLKWYEIQNASNGLLDIALGSEINEELKDYLSQFEGDSDDLQRARLLDDSHQLLVWYIGGNVDEGYELASSHDKTARALQDTTLMAITSFHLLNFLYAKRDLKTYVELGEEIYTLDGAQRKRSPYYYTNVESLLGVYSFMGGKDQESLLLADELHDNPATHFQSYFSYLELLETATEGSGAKEQIFEKFGVSSVTELVKTLNENAEGKTDNQATWRLAQRSARLLVREGEKEAAIDYIQKTVKTLQDAYSKDLAQAIADHETNLITKEKEQEVALEKEKTKFTIAIAGGIGLLLLVAILGYAQKNKQNRKIREKSEQVAGQRDEIARQNQEKELLLKEIHHRVKNNLQVVSSLLDLQSRGIEDEQALATFMEGQNRVKAMALIHQKLYQNDNLATIDFAEYAGQLMKELAMLYPRAKDVKTGIDAGDNTYFDIDTAVPLGLILNELVSNAYKYAFEGKATGALHVALESLGEGKHQLTVADSGAGLPEGFDPAKAKSLGLRLVRRLAKQLYGSVTYSYEEGAKFVVIFTDTIERKAV